MPRKKRVLITGAAGFIGSHLAKKLVAADCEVIGIDNLCSGVRKNVQELESQANFRFLELDLVTGELLSIPELAVDEIYHLASPASPKFYQMHPFETMLVNTIGTRNVLELARKYRAKFLYASTSEVYGDAEVHPQPEDYCGKVRTWGPRACYDESKRLGEVYCYEYYHLFQVRVRIARIFNTYSEGLRNDDGRVISNFLAQALGGKDLTIYGDGLQTRCFCHVDDTVRALLLMMENDRAEGEIINIGNPAEYTILEVARLVLELTESTSQICYLPLPIDDPRRRCPVIDKAREILGWEPKIDLREGLIRAIQQKRKAGP
ncbi:NAD-dependent epimerase/dehydratase family protein [Brevibacillus sp. GCM10020057]|uniref:NAD-dependent epimerase/dehydratase family protein n=1 Tax=Brevibacillus sp. GCM10020057 TaxID=3317327 RepID=UPI00362D64D7